MKKSILLSLLALLLPSVAFAAYSGTPVTPQKSGDCYQIGTAEELYGFAALVNGGETGVCGKLTADITVNENVLNDDGSLKAAPAGGFKVWTPIGIYSENGKKAFAGSFDGNGFVAKGLFVDKSSQEYVGLFGYVLGSETNTVSIKNVKIEDSYFNGRDKVGSVAGSANQYVVVSQCSYVGNVDGTQSVGGLVGAGAVRVENSFHIGNVSAYKNSTYGYAGGIVGGRSNAVVVNSYSVGSVSGPNGQIDGVTVGGTGSVVENCFSTASSKWGNTTVSAESVTDGTVAVALHNWCEKDGETCKADGKNGSVWKQYVGTGADHDVYPVLSSTYDEAGKLLPGVVKFDIEYVLNGGDNAAGAAVIHTYGTETVLPNPTFDELYFEGWHRKADLSDAPARFIATKQKIAADITSGKITYYAKWLPVYTITYLLDPEELAEGAFSKEIADAYAYVSGNGGLGVHYVAGLEMENYPLDVIPTCAYFIGWYDNTEYTGREYSVLPASMTGDISLYPKMSSGNVGLNQGSDGCYEIWTEDNLEDFLAKASFGELGDNGCGRLMRNIVLQRDVVKYDGTLNGSVSSNWPTSPNNVDGNVSLTLDGQGHTIRGLVSSNFGEGLFNHVSETASLTIKNLGIVDSYLPEGGSFVGIVQSEGSITLENCYSRNTVSKGLIGYGDGTVTIVNSYNSGSVDNVYGTMNGALVGQATSTNISVTNSYSASMPISNTGSTVDGATIASVEEFRDGTVASSLYEGANRSIWAQENDHPGFSSDHAAFDQINYVLNGGDLPSGTIKFYTLGIETALPVPTCDGCTFEGWFDNAGFSGSAVTSISASETGAKTYYAKCTADINYVLNGNADDSDVDNTANPSVYTAGIAMTLAAPTRNGYTFAGWYESADFSDDAVTAIAATATGAKTFYAKWNANINYVLNGNADNSDVDNTANPAVYSEGTAVTLAAPTRNGCTFEGWYESADFSGSAVTSIAADATGAKTFYAKWTEAEKTIVWNETDECYEIYNADGLYEFAQIVNGEHTTIAQNTAACGKLVNNIVVNEHVLDYSDAEGNNVQGCATAKNCSRVWTPIGIDYAHRFSGSFDGNGKTISGLYNKKERDCGGLIGHAGTATISNVGVVDSYFDGDDYVGGIVGVVEGQVAILNSYNQGLAQGNRYVGGLVGEDDGQVTISNSYNAGKVNGTGPYGDYGVGALVGYFGGVSTITNSFAMEGVADNLVAEGNESGAAFKTEEEFNDGTVAALLHNGTNGSIWGQDLAKANSLPDFSRAVEYRYGSVVVNTDKKATLLGNSQLTVEIPSGKTITASVVEIDRTFVPSTAGTPIANTIVLPFSTTAGTTANASFYAFKGLAKEGGVYSAKFAETIDPANLVANTPYVAILNEGATTLNINLGSSVTMESGDAKTVNGSVGETTVGKTTFNGESGWSFVGTYAYKHWDDACSGDECVYGFASKAGTLRNGTSYGAGDFVKAGKNASILPMRAYLKKTLPNGLHGAPSLNGKSLVDVPEVIECEFLSRTGVVAAVGQMNARTGEITLKKADSWFDMKGRSLGSKKPTTKGTYYNNGKMVIIK